MVPLGGVIVPIGGTIDRVGSRGGSRGRRRGQWRVAIVHEGRVAANGRIHIKSFWVMGMGCEGHGGRIRQGRHQVGGTCVGGRIAFGRQG